MAPLPPRRRVSYGVPFPPSANSIPLLWLPPLGFDRQGSIDPILVSNSESNPNPSFHPHRLATPRHRLGVSSLALDTTTQLVGCPSPEGILYTGGRDGLVVAWDLKIPMRKRTRSGDVPRHNSTRWELVTGWIDPVTDDLPDEDDDMRSDGDILGDVTGSARRRKLSSATASSGSIPFEYTWEPDVDTFRPGQPSAFRQAAQIHSDWVNDILLCNQNQTLVSASSDGTVKSWSPHSSPLSDPVTVGTHTDYVRCLAFSRDQGWVASGSFDRTVKLWDLSRASQATTTTPNPIMTLTPPDSSGAKASIYALAVDPQGHMIVSGGPERVVRMWDPRAGKRVGKLVGHTDNIRAILVSEDSRCLLTASTDASIKLWSLTSQRCLHTFTHHTDSVWALHSTHPSLEVFYSGDKSGFVARVDVEGCAHMSEAECALICQDVAPAAEGVTKLVALDDTLVWTASGSSSLGRWRAPSRRAVRAAAPVESPTSATSPLRPSRSTDWRPRSITLDLPPSPPLHRQPRHGSSLSTTSHPASEQHLPSSLSLDDGTGEGETSWFGLPYDCLVHLASPLGDPFTPFSPIYRGRSTGADADVATLYSAASLMSVTPRPPMPRTPLRGIFPSSPSPPQSPPSIGRPVSPAHSDFAPSINALGTGGAGIGGSGAAGGSVLGPHRAAFESREVVAEAQPLSHLPDYVIIGGPGLVRAALLSNRIHALTVDTIGTVSVWDIVRAVCVGQFAREDVLLAANTSNNRGGGSGGSGASHHEDEGSGVCSPREALDIVRGRIDGEAFVVPWSSVDTAMGVLNVHLDDHAFDAELYADELGLPPERVLPAGIGPDDIRINLGKWVLRNLLRGFIREQEQAHSRRMRAGAMGSPRTVDNVSATSPPSLPHSPPQSRPSSAGGTTSAPINSTGTTSIVVVARNMIPALAPIRPAGLGISHAPLPHTQFSPSPAVPVATSHIGSESTTTPQAQPPQQPAQGNSGPLAQTEVPAPATPVATQVGQDYFTAPIRRPSVSKGVAGATPVPAPVPVPVPVPVPTLDESGTTTAAGGSANTSTESNDTAVGNGGGVTPGTPGGGLIGKLRGLGRTTKRAQNEGSAPVTPSPVVRTPGSTATGGVAGAASAPSTVVAAATTATTTTTTTTSPGTPAPQETPAKPRTTAQLVLSTGMLSPPTAADGPTLPLAPDIPLLIAEERAHGWAILYRGTVTSAGTVGDVAALEDAMPVWLLEYLLLGRTQQVAIVKIQFALLPGEEQLPELVNPTQTKLSASRFLRVRKLALHVQERIESMGLGTPGRVTPHTSPRPSLDPHSQSSSSSSQTNPQGSRATTPSGHEHDQKANKPQHSPNLKPDDLWEILCNDTVLPPDMTLAVVRQYVWRQSGEVVLHYRRKRSAAMATHRKG